MSSCSELLSKITTFTETHWKLKKSTHVWKVQMLRHLCLLDNLFSKALIHTFAYYNVITLNSVTFTVSSSIMKLRKWFTHLPELMQVVSLRIKERLHSLGLTTSDNSSLCCQWSLTYTSMSRLQLIIDPQSMNSQLILTVASNFIRSVTMVTKVVNNCRPSIIHSQRVASSLVNSSES